MKFKHTTRWLSAAAACALALTAGGFALADTVTDTPEPAESMLTQLEQLPQAETLSGQTSVTQEQKTETEKPQPDNSTPEKTAEQTANDEVSPAVAAEKAKTYTQSRIASGGEKQDLSANKDDKTRTENANASSGALELAHEYAPAAVRSKKSSPESKNLGEADLFTYTYETEDRPSSNVTFDDKKCYGAGNDYEYMLSGKVTTTLDMTVRAERSRKSASKNMKPYLSIEKTNGSPENVRCTLDEINSGKYDSDAYSDFRFKCNKVVNGIVRSAKFHLEYENEYNDLRNETYKIAEIEDFGSLTIQDEPVKLAKDGSFQALLEGPKSRTLGWNIGNISGDIGGILCQDVGDILKVTDVAFVTPQWQVNAGKCDANGKIKVTGAKNDNSYIDPRVRIENRDDRTAINITGLEIYSDKQRLSGVTCKTNNSKIENGASTSYICESSIPNKDITNLNAHITYQIDGFKHKHEKIVKIQQGDESGKYVIAALKEEKGQRENARTIGTRYAENLTAKDLQNGVEIEVSNTNTTIGIFTVNGKHNKLVSNTVQVNSCRKDPETQPSEDPPPPGSNPHKPEGPTTDQGDEDDKPSGDGEPEDNGPGKPKKPGNGGSDQGSGETGGGTGETNGGGGNPGGNNLPPVNNDNTPGGSAPGSGSTPGPTPGPNVGGGGSAGGSGGTIGGGIGDILIPSVPVAPSVTIPGGAPITTPVPAQPGATVAPPAVVPPVAGVVQTPQAPSVPVAPTTIKPKKAHKAGDGQYYEGLAQTGTTNSGILLGASAVLLLAGWILRRRSARQ